MFQEGKGKATRKTMAVTRAGVRSSKKWSPQAGRMTAKTRV